MQWAQVAAGERETDVASAREMRALGAGAADETMAREAWGKLRETDLLHTALGRKFTEREKAQLKEPEMGPFSEP